MTSFATSGKLCLPGTLFQTERGVAASIKEMLMKGFLIFSLLSPASVKV